MFQNRKVFYALIGSLILVSGLLAKFLFFDNNSRLAALRVDSFPKAKVILSDKEVGQTPFSDEKIKAGEYTLRLEGAGLVWQAKIKLTAGTLTYVSRDIAPTEEQSAGQILMLEPLSSNKATELAVLSSPSDSTVTFDGLEKGKTPLILKDVTSGDHEIRVSSSGFADQIVHGKILGGFRLNVIVKLATLPEVLGATASGLLRPASDLITTASAELTKPYIIVKDTPTGFLRVRFEPSVNASEVAQIKPNEKYPLLSENNGWVRIKLPGLFGWVSEDYVEKIK